MNINGIPSLFNSILESDADGLRSKLYNKLDVNIKDSYDQNGLHIASYIGNSEVADILIKYGIDVNHKDINGVTPLFKACASNSHSILKILVGTVIDINCRDNKWSRALHVCAAHNAIECLQIMLPRVLSINITDSEGRTALHHGVANGHIEIVKILLANGASVSASDKNGARPIHWAAARGDIEILNLLIDNDANVNIRDKDDYTALHVASSVGHLDVVIKLIERGAELDCVTFQGNNPLHLASVNNHTNIVEELIKALNSPHLFLEHLKSNADQDILEEIKENHFVLIKERLEMILNSRNYQGLTPLHILAQMDNAHHCVDMLLAYGSNPNLLSENGKSPLHYAASRNQLKQALILLKASADVNIQDDHENTPLHIACRFGYEKFVQLLIEYKANAFLAGEDGMLPIHVATAFKNCGCMHKLLDSVVLKTHINNLDDDCYGRNLVHCAVTGGSLKCLETIIRLGGDIHHEDNMKQTPLHLAVKLNNFMIARILIKLGASLDVEDEYLCTPIHYAAIYNKEGDILKLLIENGASILTPVNINDHLSFLENNMIDNSHVGKKIVYPVHFAVMSGNFNGMMTLLDMMPKEAKMDCIKGHVDSSSFDYQSRDDVISLISLASYHDHFDVLNYLVRVFTKNIVSTQDRNGRTALHLAAYQGHATNVKYLISCGAKPAAVDKDYYWNALHYAASQGCVDALGEIIQSVKAENRKFLVDSLDEHKRSPLMIAVQNGHTRAAEKLIMSGADVDLKDTYGRTSLHRASANGHIECVDLLLDCNAKIELFDFRGRNAFYMAATAGHKEILVKLINYVKDKYYQSEATGKTRENFLRDLKALWFDQDYLTPLHFSAAKGHKICMEILFQLSEELQSMNGFMTPLHCAVESKCDDTLESLLKLSANSFVNTADKYSWTPIFYAVQDDNVGALEKLILANADINYQDCNGCSPIMIAAKEGALSCLNLLLDCQTLKWALLDKYNQNILHYAAQSNDDAAGILIFEKLPSLTSLINVQNSNLQTPAHLAGTNSLPLLLSALISNGADMYMKNFMNQLPIVACGHNAKASDCIEICLASMFSSADSPANLALKTNLNSSPKKNYVINLKETEMEGSVQSSENEYF